MACAEERLPDLVLLDRMRPTFSGLDSGADDDITKPFSPAEYRLLRHLLEHPRRVFSREQILDAVWGRDIFLEQRTGKAPPISALSTSTSAARARL